MRDTARLIIYYLQCAIIWDPALALSFHPRVIGPSAGTPDAGTGLTSPEFWTQGAGSSIALSSKSVTICFDEDVSKVKRK